MILPGSPKKKRRFIEEHFSKRVPRKKYLPFCHVTKHWLRTRWFSLNMQLSNSNIPKRVGSLGSNIDHTTVWTGPVRVNVQETVVYKPPLKPMKHQAH